VIFSWNRANTEHIAKHGVKRAEAEQVVRGARPPWPTKSEDGKRLVWGQTSAGRYLQVIFFYPDDEDVDVTSLSLPDLISWSDGHERVIYVIHARNLEDDEKKQFRKRRRSK
jgi:uncharacterized DUF497 family protein